MCVLEKKQKHIRCVIMKIIKEKKSQDLIQNMTLTNS